MPSVFDVLVFDPAVFDIGVPVVIAPDSSDIDAALVAVLYADSLLRQLMPDGVWMDEAPPGLTRFVLVSLIDERDVPVFGGRAFEDALYAVKAVALGTASGIVVKAAASRIDALLEDQSFDVAGYTWMTTHRETRVRAKEVDDLDPSIRWFHRGGHYRVQVARAA